MTKEELEKEAEEFLRCTVCGDNCHDICEEPCHKADGVKKHFLTSVEPREKRIAELEAQLTIKIINCIKSHLCKQDEDYDKPIISPKFLSDTLDQMAIDGFEGR